MKKIIALMIISMCIMGCKNKIEIATQESHPSIEIDGCEYITWAGSHMEVGITHKGNCKNKIHIYNKEKCDDSNR